MTLKEREKSFDERAESLLEIGIALSTEPDLTNLLEMIVENAKELTGADGGTLYTLENQHLRFEILRTDSLNYCLGGKKGAPIPFAEIPLFLEDGQPNMRQIVTSTVHRKRLFNIADAYSRQEFDFSRTREFDEGTGYHTKAVLTIPIMDHEGEVVSVLQLINPLHPVTGDIVPFDGDDEQLARSLASLAGVALSNRRMISDLRVLFHSFIRSIAAAVDEKSPTTYGHEERVPELAEMLARAVDNCDQGPLKDVHFSSEQLEELKVASLLHDCGKITTPIHIVDKKMKLETVFDRIALVETRITLAAKDLEINRLKKEIGEEEFNRKNQELEEYRTFIQGCNEQKVKIDDQALATLDKLQEVGIITEEEKKNLAVVRGNLTVEEKEVIKRHVVMTYKMLHEIPFPKHLRRVPEIAASHHERVDGKGYPRGLKGEEIPLRARILTIADVFEALSAPDRPYKMTWLLSKVLRVMREMCNDGYFDRNVFDVFINQKVYLQYAREYLSSEQIDVD
ncbi:MAG: GAF and HD-GYP domain-containing protein [Chlamydiales bacterium]